MTLVHSARITETPQRRRTVFITVHRDKFLVAARTCLVRGYCRTEQMADCSTLWAHRMQHFSFLSEADYGDTWLVTSKSFSAYRIERAQSDFRMQLSPFAHAGTYEFFAT